MAKDFTLKMYRKLLESLIDSGYHLTRFDTFIQQQSNHEKSFILRHDVDRKPQNALNIARIQAEFGVQGTYYFRIVPESFQPKYIESIAELGHEIGYHYEDLTICKGDKQAALKHFERSLEELRKYYPVNTICMHGSPMTKWDNRDVWSVKSYRAFGILAEPYFDVNFDDVYYLTDTGRRWDGDKVSIRDKVNQSIDFSVSSTSELIAQVRDGRTPYKIMQNIHPERWTDKSSEWMTEWSKSAIKNPVKRMLNGLRPN